MPGILSGISKLEGMQLNLVRRGSTLYNADLLLASDFLLAGDKRRKKPMKAIRVKSLALLLIVAFAFVLMPQQAEANNPCADARLACAIARIAAAAACARRPAWCNTANQVADAICDWADAVCNNNNN